MPEKGVPAGWPFCELSARPERELSGLNITASHPEDSFWPGVYQWPILGPAPTTAVSLTDQVPDSSGCVQVPGDGQPIVLMRDCQPPGGYPKIATLVSADFGRLAQSRPGTILHFRQVGIAEAQLLRRRMVAAMAAMRGELAMINNSVRFRRPVEQTPR